MLGRPYVCASFQPVKAVRQNETETIYRLIIQTEREQESRAIATETAHVKGAATFQKLAVSIFPSSPSKRPTPYTAVKGVEWGGVGRASPPP